jgi:multicomponent Na+:H+ antiporter subunit B
MMLIIEAILLLGLIAIATAVIFGRDPMVSVVIYCAFSFITMFLYIIMGAPDVAFTEAVIGVISTVFFIIILRSIRRDAKRRGEK